MGNTTREEATFSACELCGFNTGLYEQKIVTDILVMLLPKKLLCDLA